MKSATCPTSKLTPTQKSPSLQVGASFIQNELNFLNHGVVIVGVVAAIVVIIVVVGVVGVCVVVV